VNVIVRTALLLASLSALVSQCASARTNAPPSAVVAAPSADRDEARPSQIAADERSAHAAPQNPAPPALAFTFGTPLSSAPAGLADATFAAGCFWCVESSFEGVRGVRAVISGYTGGPELRPTYEQVCDHATGHAEAVRVVYDPREVSYAQLLAVFWRLHDPTTRDQSFYDSGHQYRSAIFAHSPEQRAEALASKQALESARRYRRPIVTEISDAGAFWPAEDYHQDYYRTHPVEYHRYRDGSGRDAYIEETWGAGALQSAQRH
jgi:methionine-S-sulfoxide reductase